MWSSVVRFCLARRLLPKGLSLVRRVVVQGKATIEVGLSVVAQMNNRIDSAAQAGFGPACIDGKRFARQIEPRDVSVISVVLHQADGIVVSTGTLELGAAQGVFVGHPPLNHRVLGGDIRRNRRFDIARSQQDAVQLGDAFFDQRFIVKRG